MMLLEELTVPSDLATAGAWFDVPDMPPLAFRVRPLWNTDMKALFDRLVSEVPESELVRGRITPEEEARILGRCLAETVLTDWSGLAWEPDRPLLYSLEMATEFMLAPEYRRIRNMVQTAAETIETTWRRT